MSFGFTAVGDRDQAIAQLEAAGGGDPLKSALIELIAGAIEDSELHGYKQEGTGHRQVYVIEAGGHSGPGAALSLTVSVKCPYIPVIEDAAVLAEPEDDVADEDDQD